MSLPPSHPAAPRLVEVVTVVCFAAAVFLALLALEALVTAVLVILLGLVLATAIDPVVRWLARAGLPRRVSTLLLFATMAAFGFGVVVLVGPLLLRQTSELAARLPALCQKLDRALAPQMDHGWARLLRAALPNECRLGHVLTPLSLVQGGLKHVNGIGNALWLFAGTFVIGSCVALERPRLLRLGLLALPAHRREPARVLLRDLQARVGAFVRGQALLSLLVGVLVGCSYAMLGVPNPLGLGALAAVLEIVPVAGPIVSAAAGLLAVASQAPELVPVVLVIAGVLRLLVDYVFLPSVMGRSMGVNPLLLLVTLAAFGSVGGALGAMLAIPAAAVMQRLAELALLAGTREAVATGQGRDRLARVRYDAASLAAGVRRFARRRARPVSASTAELEEEVEALADAVVRLASRLEGHAGAAEAEAIRVGER